MRRITILSSIVSACGAAASIYIGYCFYGIYTMSTIFPGSGGGVEELVLPIIYLVVSLLAAFGGAWWAITTRKS